MPTQCVSPGLVRTMIRCDRFPETCMDSRNPECDRGLIRSGYPQREDEEAEEVPVCRCCCGGTHRDKRRLFPVLLFVILLLLTLTLVVLVWFGLTQNKQDRKSADSTPSDSNIDGQTSALRDAGVKKWPSAMLTAPIGKHHEGNTLLWESNLAHAFLDGDFRYKNGSLEVPIKGIYRVFLQITYEDDKCLEPDTWLLGHVLVITDTYDTNTRLLSVADGVRCVRGPWRKSLYAAGLHRLEAGSRLLVNASIPRLLAKNEDQVFFGAELVKPLLP